MRGTLENAGIISCAIQHLFDYCKMDSSREYSIRISMMEIYNETIADLLSPEKGPLKIHESVTVAIQTFSLLPWMTNSL